MVNPRFDNGFAQLYQADARSLPIPDASIDCVVTSPPYWGLRDYGLDNGIGLEATPEDFCANMVKVFREVWRVLKPTGTVWLNLGDSYAHSGQAGGQNNGMPKDSVYYEGYRSPRYSHQHMSNTAISGIKPKDLLGMPWRVAFALQADGWYLRSDIIWSKPNPMPESVTDRPTKAHEYVFLLTKSPRYYYDADAIREPDRDWGIGKPKNGKYQNAGTGLTTRGGLDNIGRTESGRNKRTVWEITTQPYPEAHFATYPEKLVEPCILAGTSEKGVCAVCGKPWERMVELTEEYVALLNSGKAWRDNEGKPDAYTNRHPTKHPQNVPPKHNTIGWQPTCECNADTIPATVLDPFAGSGTTLAVAQRLGRRAIGTDLKAEYLDLASKRLGSVSLPLF